MKAREFLDFLSNDKFLPDLPDSETIFTLKWMKELLDRQEKHTPTTVKDVLLEQWAQETNDMAEFMVVELPEIGKWVAVNERGSEIGQYRDRYRAIAAQIAYLNSAAEVGK